jgi:hypothetical protein
MAKTIKMAGPDAADKYRVLQTKGTLTVRPGELYSERYVRDCLLRNTRYDVTIIMPRFEEGESPLSGGLGTFKGTETG